MKKLEEIFAGRNRRRFPAMHMITARDGGVPLRDALAGHFFMMLHDKYEHNCLIKPILEEAEKEIEEKAKNASSAEAATLGMVFNQIGLSSLMGEEFAYLDDSEAYIFYLLAGSAIQSTQDWLAVGIEKPARNPVCGPLVEVPFTTKTHFGKYTNSEEVQKARNYIAKLKAEFEVDITIGELLAVAGLVKTYDEAVEILKRPPEEELRTNTSQVIQIGGVIGTFHVEDVINVHRDYPCEIRGYNHFQLMATVTKEVIDKWILDARPRVL